mmetsp:Transcript_6982/g.16861  ORF Transcript_6982/g.16861 Transcript_6982/m.16861 type:complete len:258 (+) Transcript_6982:956-1729(+)
MYPVTNSAPVGGSAHDTMMLLTLAPAGPPGMAATEAGATARGGREVTWTRAERTISWYTPPCERNSSVASPGAAQVSVREVTRVPPSSYSRVEGERVTTPATEGTTVTTTLDSGVVSRPTEMVCEVICASLTWEADTRKPGPYAVTATVSGTVTVLYVLLVRLPVLRLKEMVLKPSPTCVTVKDTPPVSRATRGPLTVATEGSEETAVTVTGSAGRVSKATGSCEEEVGCTKTAVTGSSMVGGATATSRASWATDPW